MAVSRVTIHHQGAGKPTDTPSGDSDPYTVWIGPTRWTRIQSPYTSYATFGHNHTSYDVVLSGDRTNIPVTDTEIRLIGEAVADGRNRGEVVARPEVFPHSESFETACPGNKTRERFVAITVACQAPPDPTLTAAQQARLIAMDKWRHRVHDTALRYGDQSHDIRILVNLLKRNKFLPWWVFGDKYGERLREAVVKFKNTVPALAGQPAPWKGKVFGGDAADALVALG